MKKPSIKTITLKNILAFFILSLITTVLLLIFNFRSFSRKIIIEESKTVAELIKAGLTTQMKGNISNSREYYAYIKKSINKIDSIQIIGMNKDSENLSQDEDLKKIVLQVQETKEPVFVMDDFEINPKLRAVIPYIASTSKEVNCLQCHNVKEGTVLGVANIVFNMSSYRKQSIIFIIGIIIISVIFIILIAVTTSKTIQKNIKIPLENLIIDTRKAYEKRTLMNPENVSCIEFEEVVNGINLFNMEIIANQQLVKQKNKELIDLNDEIEETLRETIYSIGLIEEQRSKETNNHTKRVSEYCRLMAEKAGLTKYETELIYSASQLHDIGKLGIEDTILLKPEKLTREEYELIKNHTKIGYAMLYHSKRDILKAAAVIAYQHHERWDGKGYPQGLKKEEIHTYSRITAFADVFDALCNKRVYKTAWTIEDITKYMKDEKGKSFDPAIIDIFLNDYTDFIKINEKYK